MKELFLGSYFFYDMTFYNRKILPGTLLPYIKICIKAKKETALEKL